MDNIVSAFPLQRYLIIHVAKRGEAADGRSKIRYRPG